ncbi:hypothetical protein SAMN05216559_2314 [Halomicrobium zhouii]|uniref:Uncharacterized protein n=1 Tax=Halomicrobium zhouii TaxID=767519 RepID=A0A1I6L9I6_9EURY|nr:DUF6735 family protein [Halomicrobium zhouii]SFS00129.1 hypothetical protein SAMN05216559_2314 [Halomicrobium zhouii]
MAHRALVAYERPDGRFNLHYSHEGAYELRLATDITADTPFGGGVPSTDQRNRLDLMLEVQPGGAGISVDSGRYRAAPVEMEPKEIALALETICEGHVDYLTHEAFYVVDRDFDVTAYRTFSFAMDHVEHQTKEGDTVGNGALVPVRWNDGEPVGDGVLRGRLHALRSITRDTLDRDVFDEDEAQTYMIEKLQTWVHDDAEIHVHSDTT